MNGIIEFNIWTVMKTVVSGKNLTERMGRGEPSGEPVYENHF